MLSTYTHLAATVHRASETYRKLYIMSRVLSGALASCLGYLLEFTTTEACLQQAICNCYRSQWPRALRHELPSPARTLGSWVRIPLKAWISVYVYSGFVLFCVGSGLATRTDCVYRIKKLKKRPRSNKGLYSHSL
jgi:hypothetical protein